MLISMTDKLRECIIKEIFPTGSMKMTEYRLVCERSWCLKYKKKKCNIYHLTKTFSCCWLLTFWSTAAVMDTGRFSLNIHSMLISVKTKGQQLKAALSKLLEILWLLSTIKNAVAIVLLGWNYRNVKQIENKTTKFRFQILPKSSYWMWNCPHIF